MEENSYNNSDYQTQSKNNNDNFSDSNEYTSNYQTETINNNNFSNIKKTEYESNNFQTTKNDNIYNTYTENKTTCEIQQTEISNNYKNNKKDLQSIILNKENIIENKNENIEKTNNKKNIETNYKESKLIKEKKINKENNRYSNINSEFEKNIISPIKSNKTENIKYKNNESFLNDSIRSKNEIVQSLNNLLQNSNQLDKISEKEKFNSQQNKSQINISLKVQNNSKIDIEEISSLKRGNLNEIITPLNLKELNLSNDLNDEEITIFKRTNRSNENPKIFLCPYCKKHVPLITSLISKKINNSSKNIINTKCKCGNYSNNLSDYINLFEKNISIQNENCYNKNHQPIKGIEYCSICKKFFCETCLQFHKDYLPDHITSPYKIDHISFCFEHSNPIENYCENCKIGICKNCKNHDNHDIIKLNQYWNQIYFFLPFKNIKDCENYLDNCNKISEKEMKSFIDYIDNFIEKLKNIEDNIKKEYEESKKRREEECSLIKYLFSNFLAFNNNYIQIKNMEKISFLCPSIFLCLDKDFIKEALEYTEYLKKNSIIEISEDSTINIFQFQNLLKKYNKDNNKKNNNIFKIYDTKGIYYGQFNNNREGIGIQYYKNGDIFEGIWENGNFIKGKANYYNGNIFEGDFKNGKENGFGIKTYNNGEIYKGCFTEGKKQEKGFIEKFIEN